MSQHVTVLCWNLKRNGAGDTTKRRRAHELLASLDPHLVLRQEMDGAAADGNRIMYEVEAVLGLRGWLGPRACTAVFANPTLFQPLRVCEDVGPVWVHPPTVAVFRFTPGGSQSLPLVVASYHLNHASATTRQAEVERLTKWADRKWTMPDGERMLMPALMGGDNNSYPVPGLEGDLPLPDLEQIADRPHRLHRSHIGRDGQRLLDTCPDEALRTAGLEDVARYWANTRDGDKAAASRTMNASPTHGPDTRIDRIYATPALLGAVREVDVIEVEPGISDHHIVRLTLDADRLTDALTYRPRRQAAPAVASETIDD
ncbi:endonuclease/exonuclease/phosphatase family protein [Streptomyces virginiae]|uniref:endonuclease/exonuclease/phosphatase family protein n=1 Tax=Streptomyces TaxID=1883 RepID=UPI0028882E79|nr:endonuclease/exonuclease/phosphatase family protein [Streptomyces sp. DSM 41633]